MPLWTVRPSTRTESFDRNQFDRNKLSETEYTDQMFRPEYIRPEQIITDRVHGPNVACGRSKIRWKKKRTRSVGAPVRHGHVPHGPGHLSTLVTEVPICAMADGEKNTTTDSRCPLIWSFSGRCIKNVPVLLGGVPRYIET